MFFLSSFFNVGLCALDVMMDDLKLLALLCNYPLGIVTSIFTFQQYTSGWITAEHALFWMYNCIICHVCYPNDAVLHAVHLLAYDHTFSICGEITDYTFYNTLSNDCWCYRLKLSSRAIRNGSQGLHFLRVWTYWCHLELMPRQVFSRMTA